MEFFEKGSKEPTAVAHFLSSNELMKTQLRVTTPILSISGSQSRPTGELTGEHPSFFVDDKPRGCTNTVAMLGLYAREYTRIFDNKPNFHPRSPMIEVMIMICFLVVQNCSLGSQDINSCIFISRQHF